MEKVDYAFIDASQWQPVQVPGLQSPKHQLSYDSTEVQRVLKESFKTMFPDIVTGPKGDKRYQIISERGEDIFAKAEPVKNINDIPRAEMMRLMEGWIRLRRKVQEGEVPSRASSILLNFRVPNPRESLDRYMVYKEFGESKLVIRWGYENAEHRAVSLERAISVLMDVPLGHMRSILSTTMSPSTSTVLVGQSPQLDEVKEEPQASGSQSKAAITGVIAACAVLGVAAGVWFLLRSPEVEPQVSLASDEPELTVAIEEKPRVPDEATLKDEAPEEVVPPVAEPAIAVELAPSNKPEPKPRVPEQPKDQPVEVVEAKPPKDMMAEMLGSASVQTTQPQKSLLGEMLAESTSATTGAEHSPTLVDRMLEKKTPVESENDESIGLESMIKSELKPKSFLEEMSH